jgi:hypothetical protein
MRDSCESEAPRLAHFTHHSMPAQQWPLWRLPWLFQRMIQLQALVREPVEMKSLNLFLFLLVCLFVCLCFKKQAR